MLKLCLKAGFLFACVFVCVYLWLSEKNTRAQLIYHLVDLVLADIDHQIYWYRPICYLIYVDINTFLKIWKCRKRWFNNHISHLLPLVHLVIIVCVKYFFILYNSIVYCIFALLLFCLIFLIVHSLCKLHMSFLGEGSRKRLLSSCLIWRNTAKNVCVYRPTHWYLNRLLPKIGIGIGGKKQVRLWKKNIHLLAQMKYIFVTDCDGTSWLKIMSLFNCNHDPQSP